MFCIISDNTDPYFNLSAEEYFFKEFKEDIFMLWRSESAVIVGKHQNTLAEINYDYVKNNNIGVAPEMNVQADKTDLNSVKINDPQVGAVVQDQDKSSSGKVQNNDDFTVLGSVNKKRKGGKKWLMIIL